MRYLGNKESISDLIVEVLREKGLLNGTKTFFDAFCGTGTISNAIKDYCNLIINDNLSLATTFSKGRIFKGYCDFSRLGCDPIEFFNSNRETRLGFFSKNYSPALSGRMYFNDFNAGRIDYFREQIQNWKDRNLIDDESYCYLLACLLESVSKVANIAGVYGAYLKQWDPRAVKDIIFLEVESEIGARRPLLISSYNNNLADIIGDIECDIIYLDPPYTKNKYSVQYHLIETLIRNDNPQLKGITGTRDLSFASSSWSIKNNVEVEFESTIAKTKAKYILLSYSSDGLMSKEYILSVLRRYGKEATLVFKEINYKKYRNSRTFTTDEHFEFLFFVEKKDEKDIEYYCPLNYMGGKTNVIEHLKPSLSGKTNFVDLMGGGFNVGSNVIGYESVIYNDINFIVKDLLLMFKQTDTVSLLKKIDSIITKYGLEKHNKDAYFNYRDEYNNVYRYRGDYTIYLYTLILYGFQQQIRFNSNYEFNNPVGESGFNDSIKEKIVSFSRRLKELNVNFYSGDYEKIEEFIDSNTLVYIDPPYLITLGSYNDGKRGFNGWNEQEELRLINFINRIKQKNCKIVISNILNYKGKDNKFLIDWIADNHASVKSITVRGRGEVLVIYETNF